MKIVAFDVETANFNDASICAVGLAVFDDGKLADSFYSLVKPPKRHGWFIEDWIENCHHLTHVDVRNASDFPAIASEVFSRLAAADIVVAHNAQFDMRKLCGTVSHFGLEVPTFDCLCTFALAKRVWPKPLLPNHDLATVAAHIGHRFEHHHAAADAEAAGRILLAMMNAKNAASPQALAQLLGVAPRRVGGDG